ncbi:MAG: outer membrane lipid asymmetry maintenance protein MlaD [Desulfovibrionaceae bacterium]|nr:outer membrane lipid asymmetry maintenance protein MlaD [Desulfovibrionaceae bacterium]
MNSFRETLVGVFVLLGLICVAYLTIRLGKMDVFGQEGFLLKARFESVSGLRTGADVEMAGVPIGKVSKIEIDPDPMRTQAVVYLLLKQDFKLSDDTIASIKTSGLIGDKYVNLSRGGSETILAHGEEIQDTQSAVDIESLLGKYAFGGV